MKLMAGLVRQYRTDQRIREVALRIVGHLRNKHYLDELEAVRLWVRRNVRYTRDVHGVETLHTPAAVLDLMQGDCDDQAILVAALLESIGMRTRFVSVGPNRGNYVHVFAEAHVSPYGWVAAETTEQVPLGWRPKMPAEMVQDV